MIPAASVHGRMVAPEDALVSATDRGLLHGEGVYETCGIIAGVPFALGRHLARLRRSATQVGLPLLWSDDELRAVVAEVVANASGPSAGPDGVSGAGRGGAGRGDARDSVVAGRLRITVTGGDGPLGPDGADASPTLLVMAGPTHRWAPTSNVAISTWRLNEHAPTVGVKATSRLDGVLALRHAQVGGADEAVMANTAGVLCEGTGSNVFLVVDGALSTPSLETGCLPGVTRQLVCELLAEQGMAVVERDDLGVDDLRKAPEAFLSSSTRNVHPIASVDAVGLGGSVPGPRTVRAATALAALQVRDLDP